MRKKNYVFTLTVLFTLITSFFVVFDDIRAETNQNNPLSPLELSELASKVFPEDLASSVKEQIRLQSKKNLPQKKSIWTLYLADKFYKNLKTGSFQGRPTITWDGFDEEYGRPTFIFKKTGFSYLTSSGRRISPGLMETDGGSIPKLLHSFGSFTPWTYGPAFIIHDWIFSAQKCNTKPDSNISFEESAQIMAEAIKTLMEVGVKNKNGVIQKLKKDEDTLYLMYLAVKSNFAKSLWNEAESEDCNG